MEGYTALAALYDGLTADVDYQAFFQYYMRILKKYRQSPAIVLDIGCGTGTLALQFARAGYSVIGADPSADMLAAAQAKAAAMPLAARPLFLHQKASRLNLYGTVQLAYSSLDCINYIKSEAELAKSFEKISLFLEPGCLFVFDVRPAARLAASDGHVVVKESEEGVCIWRTSYQKARRLARYDLDIFARAGEGYQRRQETQYQRAYDTEVLAGLLSRAGFEKIDVYGDFTFTTPKEKTDRIFIVAIRKK